MFLFAYLLFLFWNVIFFSIQSFIVFSKTAVAGLQPIWERRSENHQNIIENLKKLIFQT